MTITISNERQYIEDGNACVYVDKYDGLYVYSDVFGYKTYKTLKGLNAHIAKAAKMANREAVKVVA